MSRHSKLLIALAALLCIGASAAVAAEPFGSRLDADLNAFASGSFSHSGFGSFNGFEGQFSAPAAFFAGGEFGSSFSTFGEFGTAFGEFGSTFSAFGEFGTAFSSEFGNGFAAPFMDLRWTAGGLGASFTSFSEFSSFSAFSETRFGAPQFSGFSAFGSQFDGAFSDGGAFNTSTSSPIELILP